MSDVIASVGETGCSRQWYSYGYKVVGGLNSMGDVIASVGETGAADSGMHNLYIIWVQSGRRPEFGG